MRIKGVIFDLDGVLVDTVPLHFKAWQNVFAGYGKDLSFQEYKTKVDGIPTEAGVKAILPQAAGEQLKAIVAQKREQFMLLLKENSVEVHPDALSLVKKLKERRIPLAVISSSKNCRFILDIARLDDFFTVVVSTDEVVRGKPHPDIFLAAAEKLNIDTAECVVVEDAVLGVKAARAAGAKCVGVDRYHDSSRLAEADLIVSDLGSLTVAQLEQVFS